MKASALVWTILSLISLGSLLYAALNWNHLHAAWLLHQVRATEDRSERRARAEELAERCADGPLVPAIVGLDHLRRAERWFFGEVPHARRGVCRGVEAHLGPLLLPGYRATDTSLLRAGDREAIAILLIEDRVAHASSRLLAVRPGPEWTIVADSGPFEVVGSRTYHNLLQPLDLDRDGREEALVYSLTMGGVVAALVSWDGSTFTRIPTRSGDGLMHARGMDAPRDVDGDGVLELRGYDRDYCVTHRTGEYSWVRKGEVLVKRVDVPGSCMDGPGCEQPDYK